MLKIKKYVLPKETTLVAEGWRADHGWLLREDGQIGSLISLRRYFDDSQKLFVERFEELMVAAPSPDAGDLQELKVMLGILIEVKGRLAGNGGQSDLKR